MIKPFEIRNPSRKIEDCLYEGDLNYYFAEEEEKKRRDKIKQTMLYHFDCYEDWFFNWQSWLATEREIMSIPDPNMQKARRDYYDNLICLVRPIDKKSAVN